MRPLDDVFSSSSSTRPKSRPSSITSRSPSPGLRHGTAGGATGGGGLTFFLTEENNFGVHSMTESHLMSSSCRSISRSPPLPSPTATASVPIDAEIIDKLDDDPETSNSFDADTTVYIDPVKKTDKPPESNIGATMSAIPAHVFDRGGGLIHSPSIASTISTPSSPRHNLSSSAISDDSELDVPSHHEEDTDTGASNSISSSFPQLVMPRVNMPRRKAFTETGRTMGKLKIMVVGDSGTSPLYDDADV